jgi:hypothetical protein
MDNYEYDYIDDIKEKKSCIYRNFNSKKRFKMYFENLTNKERKKYMEEQNLKEINLNTITFREIKTLDKENQKFILENLLRMYGNVDSDIAKQTNLSRMAVRDLRDLVGYPRSKGGERRPKKGTNITYEYNRENPKVIELISEPIKKESIPENIEEITPENVEPDKIVIPEPIKKESLSENIMSLKFKGCGEEIKEKLNILCVLLNKNQKYEINFNVTEVNSVV